MLGWALVAIREATHRTPTGIPIHSRTEPIAMSRIRRRPSARAGPEERRRLARDPLEDIGRDVEVRVDRVHVVVALERVDEPHELRRRRLLERDPALGQLRDLGGLGLDAGLDQRFAHPRQGRRFREDLEDVVVARDVLGAGVDGDDEVVLRPARAVDDDHALLVEEVADRARLAEVAAVLGEQVADLGSRAVAVVRQRLDEEGDAAGAVALVDHGLDRVGVRALARALGDRALDVVLRHRGVPRLLHREPERRVPVDIASALTGGDRDGPRQLREVLAAARVDDRLLVLDRRPFGVARHCWREGYRGPYAPTMRRSLALLPLAFLLAAAGCGSSS